LRFALALVGLAAKALVEAPEIDRARHGLVGSGKQLVEERMGGSEERE